MVHNLGEDAAEKSIDDRHEYRALGYLKTIFPLAVTEPIKMHINAKRYLCAVNKDCWDSLSPASKTSLELQDGIFLVTKANEFISQPYTKDAVKLRIWDDLAKLKGLVTPELDYFLPAIEKSVVNNRS